MRRKTFITGALIIGVCLMIGTGHAQVAREDGVDSVAGVLYQDVPSSSWTFNSMGGEILFVTLDADIYRKPMGGHAMTEAGSDSGGCSDDGSGGCSDDGSGGCSGGGGPFLFYIKVTDRDGNIVNDSGDGIRCYAERPAPPPGWQRDPRLACELPRTGVLATYTLEVGLTESAGGDNFQISYPFVLNVSLRKIAPTGVNLQRAISLSISQGF